MLMKVLYSSGVFLIFEITLDAKFLPVFSTVKTTKPLACQTPIQPLN